MRLTTLDWRVTDKVVTITLNNKPVNALSTLLIEELTQAMDAISASKEIRAVVLIGAGHVFCAGADLKSALPDPHSVDHAHAVADHARRLRDMFESIQACEKPAVCALNGPALGAGLVIAACCDMLIASTTASMGLPEIDVGLFGGASHAMRLFGHSKLRRMAMTGVRVDAKELYRLGIVEDCVSGDALLPAAQEMASQAAEKSPEAIRFAKQTLNAMQEMSLWEGYQLERSVNVQLSRTADAAEARRAFLEKRKPIF